MLVRPGGANQWGKKEKKNSGSRILTLESMNITYELLNMNACFVQTKYDYSLRSPPLLLEKVGLLRLAGYTDNKVQVICNLNLDARFVVQLDRTLNALGLVVNNCCASE